MIQAPPDKSHKKTRAMATWALLGGGLVLFGIGSTAGPAVTPSFFLGATLAILTMGCLAIRSLYVHEAMKPFVLNLGHLANVFAFITLARFYKTDFLQYMGLVAQWIGIQLFISGMIVFILPGEVLKKIRPSANPEHPPVPQRKIE